MSDEPITDKQTETLRSLDALVDGVSGLRAASESQAHASAALAASVKENNDLANQNRKVLNRINKLMIAKLLTLFLLTVGLVFSYQANHRLIDCTVPGGACKARGDAIAGQYAASFAYVNEATRLTTEIRIAQARGDQLSVDMRSKRLAEVQDLLRQIAENIDAINHDKPIPYPGATAIAAPVTQSRTGGTTQ